MGFFRFLGRHILASILGAVGVTLAILGYADQARDVLTGFDPWQLQASGAGLFVVAVVMILYRWDQEQSLKVAQGPHAPSAPREIISDAAPPKAERIEAAPKPPPSSSGKRIYVGENITPKVLSAMFEGKTTLQGKRATEPFVGKWMRVSGTFKDLSMINERIASLSLRHPYETSVRLYFRTDFERLEILHGGERLTIDGEIERIDPATVALEKCEIVSMEAVPAT